MPATSDRAVDKASVRTSIADTLAVYLQRRVLIVMFLGFSSGLPLALSGSTLLIWMREAGVDLGTIGLFALVGTPYTIKFIWAPVIDALDVPLLSRYFGRRRGWLVLSQLLLMGTIVFLGTCDPSVSAAVVAVGALLVATASATQDIVVDAFRVESLDESEQAAGMASYVAAYRIGMLVSTAGALFLVSGFESLFGLARHAAWSAGYMVMAGLVIIGMVTALVATEPEKSAAANAAHAREGTLARLLEAAVGAFSEFLSRDMALVALAFVVLFKFSDALAGSLHRALRHRSRLLAQRICRHHQGRGACRHPHRRLCRRLCGACLLAAGEPVDRRRVAGCVHAVLFLAGGGGAQHRLAHFRHRGRKLHQRRRHCDLCRLPLGAVP